MRQGLSLKSPFSRTDRISSGFVAREECVYPMVRPGACISEMTLGTREMTN